MSKLTFLIKILVSIFALVLNQLFYAEQIIESQLIEDLNTKTVTYIVVLTLM